jgi:hypothetical protein
MDSIRIGLCGVAAWLVATHASAQQAAIPGRLVGWGANSWGQAQPPANLGEVRAVSAGFEHSLALRLDGSIVA